MDNTNSTAWLQAVASSFERFRAVSCAPLRDGQPPVRPAQKTVAPPARARGAFWRGGGPGG
eukprot:8025750-Alexandrium_andersonii.AAC.1